MLPGGASGSLPEIRVQLHESATGKTQSLGGAGRFARWDSRLAVVYQTSAQAGAVEVRVEAEGYAIAEKTFTITPGMRVARIDVPLTPSSTPLGVQRLNYPYRW